MQILLNKASCSNSFYSFTSPFLRCLIVERSRKYFCIVLWNGNNCFKCFRDKVYCTTSSLHCFFILWSPPAYFLISSLPIHLLHPTSSPSPHLLPALNLRSGSSLTHHLKVFFLPSSLPPLNLYLTSSSRPLPVLLPPSSLPQSRMHGHSTSIIPLFPR